MTTTENANFTDPDWAPLERLFGSDEARPLAQFMWMCRLTLPDGTVLNSYKHCNTRRYLHLDQDMRFWINTTSGYRLADSAEKEMHHVFDGASWRDWDAFMTPGADLPWPGKSA